MQINPLTKGLKAQKISPQVSIFIAGPHLRAQWAKRINPVHELALHYSWSLLKTQYSNSKLIFWWAEFIIDD